MAPTLQRHPGVDRRRGSRRAVRTVRASQPAPPPRSAVTSMLFEGLLGAAVGLAFIGLIVHDRDRVDDAGTSPADPPPAVFVQVD